MAISTETLRSAARRIAATRSTTLTEARTRGQKSVFICHSRQDVDLVKGLVTLLREAGWQAYLDWEDEGMPDVPDRRTAERIKQKIGDFSYFFFLATVNSTSSRWCPWEIGYADGKKPIERILVIPTSEGNRTFGNEYLQLYRRIDFSDARNLAVLAPGRITGGASIASL